MGLRFTQIGVILAVLLIAINPAAGKGKWYLPSMGDPDEGLYDYINKTTEDQVESARTTDPKPRRKASEDKHFSQGDSLHDEELVYWPHFDIGPWNWELPDINIRWPDLPGYADNWPQSRYGYLPPWQTYPGDGTTITSFVCLTSNCPDVVDCEDEFFKWLDPIASGEVLLNYGASGDPVFDVVLDNDGNIVVYVWENSIDGDAVWVWYEKAFANDFENSTICKTKVIVECGCACEGYEPTIYGDDNFAAGGHADIYVDSGEDACPPYDWVIDYSSSDGQGFHFNSAAGPTTATTNADLEIVSVYADGTACGTATITVTDDCGETAQAYIRYSSGGSWKWTSDYSHDCADDAGGDPHCCFSYCHLQGGRSECRFCGGWYAKVTGDVVGAKYREKAECWSSNGTWPCGNSGSCYGLFSHDCSNDSQAGYPYIAGIAIQEWKCP